MNVLEPSAGSGWFLGLQPHHTAMRSNRTAVGLDPMMAGTLKHLYPETKVYAAGIQEAPIPDNHFDIAISNVPFGKVKVYDPEFNASGCKFLTGPVHDSFFAKTLDKLRPGGLMAYITSHHTMDTPSAEAIRGYMADRADLPGAVRLPGDPFPDTDVTTDIIYPRKRAESEPSIPVAPTLDREMREMAKDLGPDALRPQRTVRCERPEDFSKAQRKRQPERLVLEDGQLRLSEGTSSRKSDPPADEIQRITVLISLWDTARKQVTMEAEDADNDEFERTRGALRQQYDNYVADQSFDVTNLRR